MTSLQFDPAEAPGILTPFIVYDALHDAVVKPMPGKTMAPSLAEGWSDSADGLTYEVVLRWGVRLHNGDLVTADDVKFSFERYRGVSAKVLKDRVRHVQVVDPHRVRFQLKEPWPDFLVFYATPASGRDEPIRFCAREAPRRATVDYRCGGCCCASRRSTTFRPALCQWSCGTRETGACAGSTTGRRGADSDTSGSSPVHANSLCDRRRTVSKMRFA